MAALQLVDVKIPNDNHFTELTLGLEQVVVKKIDPVAGAALLCAVAGLRERRWRRSGVRVGKVLVSGEDKTRKRPHERGIGYVPAGEELADEMAGALGLTASLTLRPHELLSDEERLRVALVRAAIREPAARVVHLVRPRRAAGAAGVTGAPTSIGPGVLLDLLTRAHPSAGSMPATLVLTDDETFREQFEKDLAKESTPCAAGA
jgi:hypothetical protein